MRRMAQVALAVMVLSVTSACLSPAELALTVKWDRTLACIRRHESDRGPWPHRRGYQAQNRVSTASGAYQFVNGTWRSRSTAAGKPGWARAKDAPPWVQDYVAALTLEHGGRGHWRGSGC